MQAAAHTGYMSGIAVFDMIGPGSFFKAMGPHSRFCGFAPSVSMDYPTPREWNLSRDLDEFLERNGAYEKEEEIKKRSEVVKKLNRLTKDWVASVGRAKNLPEYAVCHGGGKVFTFGSFRLGIHTPGADIDALCVAPRHVDRSDFFKSFVGLLGITPGVTDIRVVEEAYVPVVKVKFDGIEVDLLFARLLLPQIRDDQTLDDDSLLKNLDPRCVRSLNGCRVTDQILRTVPNEDTFRIALRAVRLWAKRRGLYSNILGYLGGVSWAMLVARICQMNPHAAPAVLVYKFFVTYANWDWPKPVTLRPTLDINLGYPVWDPRVNVADRYHLMPIITPVYPQQNSTFNVIQSSKAIIQREFNRGLTTSDRVLRGLESWDVVFERVDFFNAYKHYVVVTAFSKPNRSEHLAWVGFVECKLRHLASSIERVNFVSLAHVYPCQFSCGVIDGLMCTRWFIGLSCESTPSVSIDFTSLASSFEDSVEAQARTANALKVGMKTKVSVVKKKNLETLLPEDYYEEHLRKLTTSTSGMSDTASDDLDGPGAKKQRVSSPQVWGI